MPVSDQVWRDRRGSIGDEALYARRLPKFLNVVGIALNGFLRAMSRQNSLLVTWEGDG